MGFGLWFFSRRRRRTGLGAQRRGRERLCRQGRTGGFRVSDFVGTLAEFAAQTGARHDVITLFDTIEHVGDPEAFLRVVAGLLAPGGLCVLRTPNLRALELDVSDASTTR